MRIRRFAGGMAVTTLLALMLTQVDKLLLSKLVSLEDFGRYVLAASAVGALNFLVTPIASAVLPRLTELVALKNEAAVASLYHHASQWVALALLPPSLLLALYANEVMYVWTGNATLAHEVTPLLALLTWGTLFNGLMVVPYIAQLAFGWAGFSARVNFIAVAIIIPTLFWAIPRFGAIGAAWTWLVLNIGYLSIAIHFMHRKILHDEKWRWYSDSLLKPFAIGLIGGLTFRYFWVLPQERGLLAAALAGIGLALMGLVLCGLPELRSFVLHRLKKR